jgi:hypothetical protein
MRTDPTLVRSGGRIEPAWRPEAAAFIDAAGGSGNLFVFAALLRHFARSLRP